MKLCRCGHWLHEHAEEGYYDEDAHWRRPCYHGDCTCESFVWGA